MRATRREAFGAVLGRAVGSRAWAKEASVGQVLAEKPLPARKPSGPPAVGPLTLNEFEPLAKRRMTPMAYEYVCGGAGDEITLSDNQAGFDRRRHQPR